MRKRFEQDIIYTKISHILISINPFKHVSRKSGVGIYDEAILEAVRHGQSDGPDGNPIGPHVYEVAAVAHRGLIGEMSELGRA